MKKLHISGALVVLALLICQSAYGAARSWELDKGHSNIYFSVDHIFSKINGNFGEFTAEVKFDPANLGESKFSFEIEVDSIDTNIPKRDKHLQSADFFDAKSHPQITFASQKITEASKGVYDVLGKLTVKGVAYELILPLTLAGVKDHPAAKGKEVAGFNGRVTLDRLAYKVGGGKFYEMGVVGKDVDVFVSLELLSEK